MERPARAGAVAAKESPPDSQTTHSSGQHALLEAAGPSAPGDIRQLVDQNAGAISLGPGFAQQVMNWTPPPGYTPLTAPPKQGWFSRLF